MAINTQNTKIAFKKGTQTSFDKLPSFTEGTLYLTDIGNLYYANGTATNDLIQISNIHKVTSYGISDNANKDTYLNELDTNNKAIIGDYYYLVPDNMLLYKKASGSKGWSQINPDTTLVPNDGIVTVTSEQGTNKANVSTSFSDSRENVASGAFTLVGGTDINISLDPNDSTGKSILISNSLQNTNTTYNFTSSTATTGAYLNLKGSDTNTPQKILIKGQSGISVTTNGSTGITISGHPIISSIDNLFDDEGKFTTTINYEEDASLSTSSTAITPIIGYLGTTATGSYSATAAFINGIANLNVYSATAVDELIQDAKRSLNAMTYKGTATASTITGLTSSTANQCGDTYRVISDIDNVQISGKTFTAKIGDLIIFNGADNTSATFETLEVVPSGNETQLQVTGTTSTNTIEFIDSLNSVAGQATLGSIQFTNPRSTTETAPITISTTATSTGNFVVQLLHGNADTSSSVTINTATTNTTLETNNLSGLEIPGISSLKKDNNGHITEITLQKYKVIDTHATISAIEPSVENTAGTAAITFGYQLDEAAENQASETIEIKSSSLKVEASTNTANAGIYTVDLEWGTF